MRWAELRMCRFWAGGISSFPFSRAREYRLLRRLSSNIQGNFNKSYNFCNGFLAKCLETKILWNLESQIIDMALAWQPSLLYRLDCQGGCK